MPRSTSYRSTEARESPGETQPADILDPDADPESVARLIALRRLESAPRTRQELQVLLAGRGVPEDVADRVLDRFVEVGLIDDEAYALAWVATRHAGRGLGPRVLAAELRRKGIPADLIATACAQIDDDAERSRAQEWARRRSSRYGNLDARTALRRLTDGLIRRGYPSHIAAEASRLALAARAIEDDARGPEEG